LQVALHGQTFAVAIDGRDVAQSAAFADDVARDAAVLRLRAALAELAAAEST
jgi:hypothetical protein